MHELDLLDRSKARFGVGFITWSLAKQPGLLDLALERRPAAVMLSFGSPAPFIDRIKRTAAIVICQVQSLALAKEAVGEEILAKIQRAWKAARPRRRSQALNATAQSALRSFARAIFCQAPALLREASK